MTKEERKEAEERRARERRELMRKMEQLEQIRALEKIRDSAGSTNGERLEAIRLMLEIRGT